ncbi:MAG: metallophosphoesterase [Hyphomicrobiaceae bacterium]|nr:metallophosphoesterase [Hyphomicrobiaceae bacterium]
MSFTFIHTADWQIGKPFGEFAGDKPGVLRQARLEAIDKIAAVARQRGAAHVLAAGDIFDFETGSSLLVRQLVQRLASHRDITWHLISGNHDPARASSVWDDVRGAAPPANVVLHLDAMATEIARGVVLLPAPLKAKSCVSDPTAWMDHTPSPEGSMRIGLAHGSVTGFGSEGDAAVPIDPTRPRTAGLSFLALGDWHGTKRIGERVWYSGTPEPDSFPDNEPGHVLAVTLDGPTAVPRVETVRTATYTWGKRALNVTAAEDLRSLVDEVTSLGPDAQRHLMHVAITGRAHLAAHLAVGRLLSDLEPSLFHLNADITQFAALHEMSDLALFGTGALRTVAERLSSQAGNDDVRHSRVAAQALLKLAHIASNTAGGAA